MKIAINLDSIRIDGEKLKAGREATGKSIAEIAALLTLSNAQVTQLEEGGERSFYTLAHKLLAVRKYADALGFPYEDIVSGEGADHTTAAPEDALPAMQVYAQRSQANASELRLAAVARNAVVRQRTIIALVVLCILLALFAKIRGTDDTYDVHQTSKAGLSDTTPDAQNQAEVATIDAAEPVPVPKPAALAPEVMQVAAGNTNDACPPQPAGADLKSWSPAYQRKSDSRLFVVSPKEAVVCIADAGGKSASLSLKPMAGQTFTGKPPYTLRSRALAGLEIYLQGLRVKIPPETLAIRVIPTQATLPPAEKQVISTAPDA